MLAAAARNGWMIPPLSRVSALGIGCRAGIGVVDTGLARHPLSIMATVAQPRQEKVFSASVALELSAKAEKQLLLNSLNGSVAESWGFMGHWQAELGERYMFYVSVLQWKSVAGGAGFKALGAYRPEEKKSGHSTVSRAGCDRFSGGAWRRWGEARAPDVESWR